MTQCKKRKEKRKRKKVGEAPMFVMVTKVEYGLNKLLMY
jgi:hypothetical protein